MFLGWQNVYLGQGAYCQADDLSLIPGWWKERAELTFASCPLTSTCVLCHVHTSTHAGQFAIICNQFQEI